MPKVKRDLAIKKPKSVNILGIGYTIEYCDNPSDVDIYKRSSLWGQIDYWTRSIRVYDNERTAVDVWQTILHEIIHGIVKDLHISDLSPASEHETAIDVLALALIDVFTRNGWLTVEDDETTDV